MVEDPIQSLDTVTCGIFQIYFYDNFYDTPDVNNKIQNNKKNKQTNKKKIETLLNKLLVLEQDKNEKTIEQ